MLLVSRCWARPNCRYSTCPCSRHAPSRQNFAVETSRQADTHTYGPTHTLLSDGRTTQKGSGWKATMAWCRSTQKPRVGV